MKKFLTLLLALVMVLSLVSCAGYGSNGNVTSGSAGKGDSTVGTGSTTGGNSGEDESALSVCLVVGYIGDNSFNDAAYDGCVRAEEDLGIDLTVIEYGTDKSVLPATLTRAMDEGYDMIIVGNDLDYMGNTTIEEEAGNYPDTFFYIYDTGLDFTTAHSNVLGAFHAASESDFLAGAMASYMTQSGVIGWMGGAKIKGLDDFLIGYIDGCQYANPENKVAYAFIDKGGDSWNDPVTGKALSMNLYNNNGADFIHGVAGGSGDGCFDAVIDIRAAGDDSVWAIGVDKDQYAVFMEEDREDRAEVAITSALKLVGAPIYDQIEKMVNGEGYDSGVIAVGMAENAAGIVENDFFKANVPADVQASLEDIKAAAASGELVIRNIYTTSDADYQTAKENGTVNQG